MNSGIFDRDRRRYVRLVWQCDLERKSKRSSFSREASSEVFMSMSSVERLGAQR